MPHTVYVVEDHPVFCEGILALISRASDIEVVGFAHEAGKAKDEIGECHPDLVLVDVGLSDASGLDLIQDLKYAQPEQKILAVSGLDESIYAVRAIRAGAGGYLMKSEASSALLEAIRTVLRGQLYMNDSLCRRLLSVRLGCSNEIGSPLDELTDRELDVYRLIGTGATVRQIAEKLHLSPKTVETYRAGIKEKLGLESSREVLRHATVWRMQNGKGSIPAPAVGEL